MSDIPEALKENLKLQGEYGHTLGRVEYAQEVLETLQNHPETNWWSNKRIQEKSGLTPQEQGEGTKILKRQGLIERFGGHMSNIRITDRGKNTDPSELDV